MKNLVVMFVAAAALIVGVPSSVSAASKAPQSAKATAAQPRRVTPELNG